MYLYQIFVFTAPSHPGKVQNRRGRRVARHLQVPHGKLAGRIVLAEINSAAPGDFQTLDAAIDQGFEFCLMSLINGLMMFNGCLMGIDGN